MKKIVLITILLPFLIFSQGRKGVMVIFNTENDFLGINNNDENYTGALKLEVQLPNPKKHIPHFRFKDSTATNDIRFGLGATAYTPQKLEISTVAIGDRPYASLIFVNIGNTSFLEKKNKRLQTDWILGLMGTNIPGNAQSYIHEHHWLGSERPVPMGWNNQIGYDKYLILNYNTNYQQKLTSLFNDYIEINGLGKIDIGNYMINLQTGMKFAFLNINYNSLSENGTTYPKIFEPDLLINSIKIDEVQADMNKQIRLNLYIQPEIRYAIYNSTLEGRMFSNSDKFVIASSNVKRILFELNAGINLTIFDNIYLNFNIAGRSQEFDGAKRFHSWGGFTLGISPQKWYRSFSKSNQ